MSEKILQALMQLFAIVANAERLTLQGRQIVESFLKQQLNHIHVPRYLKVFDDYLILLQGKSDPNKVKKRVSVNSVKVLRICSDINKELNLAQKYIVLIRLIEFAFSSSDDITNQEAEFLEMVASSFNISNSDYADCFSLASGIKHEGNNPANLLLLGSSNTNLLQAGKYRITDGMSGSLYVLYIKSAGILFARYFGDSFITLNGLPVIKNTSYIVSQGSAIRSNKMQPLYYSDLIKIFSDGTEVSKLGFTIDQVTFKFRNGKIGLHPVSFFVDSGNLIGIMGGSGAGKSTLLNVLNTNLKPTTGSVFINGIDIHDENNQMEGLIGYVPQDDLLIEELTVFQNLFYSSKLCFGDLSDIQISKKANEALNDLGLLEFKDLRVGSPLNKSISGGQRKRLNIALELIRRPAVLFVDEPTSGLSSRDSENVMDLLKQLAIGGTLVFVVIHQPSSDIFKMFDKLLILDLGGYPVYYGNPSDSLIYFKRKANYADADESECYTCGNVNPEQVFSILESKVLDEFGNLTPERKILPEEWNRYYLETGLEKQITEVPVKQKLFVDTKKPSAWKQFLVFCNRDFLSKCGNTQYLVINLLEGPFLAFVLAYFLKYREGEEYIFRDNVNLPPFIFMGVIVALFMGLTVSAEEIIRDRRIRKRESFLNLSLLSYLSSKIFLLFIISAVQTVLFVAIGNSLLGIKGMFADYWVVLFSISCFANVLGLNISASFNEAVTIYILIPFLIIPQILLSGVMVKFENMNPVVTCYNKVPVIGEVMAARWAFEALAVNQFTSNEYEKLFFASDKVISNYTYKKDYWLPTLEDKLMALKQNANPQSVPMKRNFRTIKNEIKKEAMINPGIKNASEIIASQSFNSVFYDQVRQFIIDEKLYYMRLVNVASQKRDALLDSIQKSGLTSEKLTALKQNYANESMEDLLLNNTAGVLVREYKGKLVRHFQPVYMDAAPLSFIRAPFYVSTKLIFGKVISTFWTNITVIWIMTFILVLTLYFNVLRKVLHFFSFKGSK